MQQADEDMRAGDGSAPRKPVRHRAPLPAIEFPEDLPVSAVRAQIARTIGANRVVILSGETGSGKTTQLPKICLALGRGSNRLIGHTQPRRIAAASIARRIAHELKSPLGEIVGYKVRFSDHTRPGASIKLMTDGILLAESQADPSLHAYDTLIIDEAHERSLNIDFLLGYLKRLLQDPRSARRDLKVIVTSATIDAARFAQHFVVDGRPAPVIEVTGRMFPVEVRYRPLVDAESADDVDDRTLMEAIVDAVDEAAGVGPGDVLVFLPGEREIREAAEALRKHHPAGAEILPLYARLSTDEQERVFKPSSAARRVVLATNVAETSLTVPGIRYVVDTGLARVKRYSYRNKVEQLQVEPISRAAADQRAGRCGRVADGVCIRLYSEDDYAKRTRFTDPEVQRSSLAGVILRMKSLGLGDVAEFPFVEPPPRRAIADGYQLLAELNAVDSRNELTVIGHELAKLPLDPRVGRMLLAAREQHCLREMLIIAAALSVQDPRERPAEAKEAADQAHRQFLDERSDFLSFVRLWTFVHQKIEHKKSNRKLTSELKSHFLSPRRVREWIDVHTQLATIAAEHAWRLNSSPATFEQVHVALLTGLLGNIGVRILAAERGEPPYAGARGIKFSLWPGSALQKKGARWIVAAELVETSRLYARTIAAIESDWLERAADHLLKKSHSDPHWEKKRAEVVAFERATLYGLVVYAQRRVAFNRVDAATARNIFIRQALVEGEFETQAPFLSHNLRLIRQIRELEHKTRRLDILVDDELIYAFYERLIPPDVNNGADFERWRIHAERDQPKLLFLTRDEVMRHEAAGITTELFPKQIVLGTKGGELRLPVDYYFDPGSPRDGVTVTVPLMALNQIDADRCEWLVPGMLKEKVQVLLKSLPQKIRRHLVPLPDYAAAFVGRAGRDTTRPLIDALVSDIRSERGILCEPGDFRREAVPMHLQMNFKVVDDQGRQHAMGRNLEQLTAELGGAARQMFQQVAQADATVAEQLHEGKTDWDFGVLPPRLELRRNGQTLMGFPALVDRGTHSSIEVFDSPGQAERQHHAGMRRLFRLQLKDQIKFLQKSLSGLRMTQVRASTIPWLAAAFSNDEDLREQIVTAALDRTCLTPPLPEDRAGFLQRKDDARGKINLIAQEIARLVTTIVEQSAAVQRKLQTMKAFPRLVADVERQLSQLFESEFIVTTPPSQLAQFPRYLRAIELRIDKVKADPARDAARMAEFEALFMPWQRTINARKGIKDPRLDEFRWLLEELRVSLFAQELKTPMPVSAQRLQKFWESARQ